MKALITGASTGFGRDFAIKLSEQGYDIVAVARSKEKLEELKKEIKTNVEIEVMDLSQKENAFKLHEKYQNKRFYKLRSCACTPCLRCGASFYRQASSVNGTAFSTDGLQHNFGCIS